MALHWDYTVKPHIDYLILLADGDVQRTRLKSFQAHGLPGSDPKSLVIAVAQRDWIKNGGSHLLKDILWMVLGQFPNSFGLIR